MALFQEEVEGLRSYLLQGGFLVVDDFWGDYEWANFQWEIAQVLPEFPIVDIPFDHLYAMPVLIDYVREHERDSDLVIVSPDAGGVERARAIAKRLNTGLAIVDKRRTAPNEALRASAA